MPLLNTSEYARHKGVSPGRVSQWVAKGQIKRRRDGKIDVATADKELEANLDKSKQRKKRGGPALNRNVAQQAAGGQVSEAQARTINYLQRAKKTELEVKKLQGSLVDKLEVEEAAFNAGRQTRDSVVGLVERKGDEWHLIRNLFEFKLAIRRDLEEALRTAGENGDGEE
jgi:hypothetical protein